MVLHRPFLIRLFLSDLPGDDRDGPPGWFCLVNPKAPWNLPLAAGQLRARRSFRSQETFLFHEQKALQKAFKKEHPPPPMALGLVWARMRHTGGKQRPVGLPGSPVLIGGKNAVVAGGEAHDCDGHHRGLHRYSAQN